MTARPALAMLAGMLPFLSLTRGVRRTLALVAWGLACGLATAQTPGAVVRYGVYDNPPKIFRGTDGTPQGIFADLLTEVARQEGWQLRPVPCEWQACLEALRQGQIDLMPDVAQTDERRHLYLFGTEPALHSWSQVYRRDGVKVDSILDLRGKRVAHLDGAVQQRFFAQLADSFAIHLVWVPQPSLEQAFKAVAQGDADVVLSNQRYGDWQAPRFGLRATPLMFQPAALYFATGLQGDPALLAALDRQLVAWKGDLDSPYYRSLNRWGAPTPDAVVPAYLFWALAAVAVLLVLALLTAYWLRRVVAQKTRAIKASEERLNTILDSVDAAIYIKGKDLRYQYANRKVCEVFGRPVDEVVGQSDDAFFDPPTAAQLRHNDTKVLAEGRRLSTEETNRSQDGLREQVYLSVKLPLRDAQGQVYALCGISTDVTEQKKAVSEIHQLAFYDPLTSLPNRRLLLDHLKNAHAASARSGANGALVFIDLDNFKVVNDTQGHAEGDHLLQKIAERLGACLRPHDLLARLGGDEFVLLLRDLSPVPDQAAQEALSVARKMQTALVPPVALAGSDHEVTASMGIALFSDAQGNSQDLLRWADMAMYEAKAAGRNAVRFFNPAMQQRAQAQAAILSDMRHALQTQAFVLHYQPQCHTGGALSGVEALVRWPHPDKGMLPPAQFVQAAEDNGLIVALGDWILREGCRQMAQWAALTPGAHWRLAINVSARQFHHPDFVDQVMAALHTTGVNPQRIELELTESLLLEDVDNVLAKMAALRTQGVSFSLDDFGTGYSSLSYLKSLPIYKLKIDQSFVRDLAQSTDSQAIVRTVVALAHNLELDVIAEGVETPAQQAALQHLGCQQFQGYLFSRPVPAAELQAQWLPPSHPQ